MLFALALVLSPVQQSPTQPGVVDCRWLKVGNVTPVDDEDDDD